jgi:hypothetical protein
MTILLAARAVHEKTLNILMMGILGIGLLSTSGCFASEVVVESAFEIERKALVTLMERDEEPADYCEQVEEFFIRHPEFEIEDCIDEEYDCPVIELEVLTREKPSTDVIHFLCGQKEACVTDEMVDFWKKRIVQLHEFAEAKISEQEALDIVDVLEGYLVSQSAVGRYIARRSDFQGVLVPFCGTDEV